MTVLSPLFTALFDDAAMFPPADLPLEPAIRGHARHRLSWYADMVGPFVCNGRRLPELAATAGELRLSSDAPVSVAAVVPEGVEHVADLLSAAAPHPQLTVAAVEVPLRNTSLDDALRVLEPLRADGIACYLELPVTGVDDRKVHRLGDHGLRLKLRTGGMTIDAFHTELELAAPLVMCAAERLPFKCTAGLHSAVRHRDQQSRFEHHGFLNVVLAARIAAATGSVDATASALAQRDAVEVAAQVRALSDGDIAAVRAMFRSFGTCSIAEPVADLVAMGLVAAP
ncbi:MAG TPA: hypothetical protein VFE40_09830 [Jatrophihabitantaceae bacterium]|nr:hypothetical protein [Jatrophihabitantaceae bacterium]